MILEEIVERKQQGLERVKRQRPLAELSTEQLYSSPRRSLRTALQAPGRKIIAEVKRSSPSRGRLRECFDPVAIACAYQAAGAAAVSVLTEEHWFEGSLEHLAAVRQQVGIPLLRKDFIVDAYQIHEARAFGADAVLLMATVLGDDRLAELLAVTSEASLEALVEVHNQEELRRALGCGASIIGINNRDLRDLKVSLDTALTLAPLVPKGKLVVAESGLQSPADLENLEAVGVHSFLIGETLMDASDSGGRLRELLAGG